MIKAEQMSLNTATVKEQCNLRQAIDLCARHGIGGIAPWRENLKEFGIDEANRMIQGQGLRVSGLCRGGMFTLENQLSQNILDDNKKAVDEAVAIQSECLVMVVGGLKPNSKDLIGSRKQIDEGLFKILEYARTVKMPIAIEPLHPMYAADRACVNTLKHALDICDGMGTGIGIAVDVYHTWWDPELKSQIKRAGKERLLAFHLSDWLMETKHLLLDRGMMGDGVIDISQIRKWMESESFEMLNEVEIFSEDNWWKRDPDELIRTCVERLSVC